MIEIPSMFWFNKVKDYAAKLLPLAATVIAFFAWFFNIVALVFVAGVDWITSTLNTIQLAGGGAEFSVWPMIGLLNAIFPLAETLGILSAYFTFWAVIISVRWVKSFIPTLSN
ncbi:hypothetical protein OKA05_02980 [Luteolibacter arcticus]|uniref:DUF2523 domain-containing protein n=2 Tax=Luteolibacter arcticus TaxID=1581411 RepID=A0ABT3GDW6_9BACT|nr:hypothetical protein [Luteolibacter arcticus]